MLPATLAHKEEWNGKTEAVRRWSNILGANRRLANAKSSMLQEYNPDAACMYEIHTWYNRKDGKKEQRCILLRLDKKALSKNKGKKGSPASK